MHVEAAPYVTRGVFCKRTQAPINRPIPRPTVSRSTHPAPPANYFDYNNYRRLARYNTHNQYPSRPGSQDDFFRYVGYAALFLMFWFLYRMYLDRF